MKKPPKSDAIKEYESYLKNKKRGETLLEACRRLGLTYSRVKYYSKIAQKKARTEKLAAKKTTRNSKKPAPTPAPKDASTKRKYTKTKKPQAHVIDLPASLQESPRKNQVVLVIGDVDSVREIMSQRGF